jgi:hypothetical protein
LLFLHDLVQALDGGEGNAVGIDGGDVLGAVAEGEGGVEISATGPRWRTPWLFV